MKMQTRLAKRLTWVYSNPLLQSNVGEDLPLLNPVGEYAGLDTTAAELADTHKRAERAVKEKEAGNQVHYACPWTAFDSLQRRTLPWASTSPRLFITPMQSRYSHANQVLRPFSEHDHADLYLSVLLKSSACVSQVESLRGGHYRLHRVHRS